jgi:competence protein ComEA
MDAATLRTYKIPILLGGISVFSIVVSLVLLVKSTQTAATPIQFSSDGAEASGSALGAAIVTVDVEGAVVHPGVYTLPVDSRVEDAIQAAGGLESDADEELFARTMNRAMKLVDGGKIYVPSLSSSGIGSAGSVSNLVSVNTASQSELDTLPGVGPVTAQKIIDNRPYQTLGELVSKKAVGTALFEKIKDKMSL